MTTKINSGETYRE